MLRKGICLPHPEHLGSGLCPGSALCSLYVWGLSPGGYGQAKAFMGPQRALGVEMSMDIGFSCPHPHFQALPWVTCHGLGFLHSSCCFCTVSTGADSGCCSSGRSVSGEGRASRVQALGTNLEGAPIWRAAPRQPMLQGCCSRWLESPSPSSS